MSGEEASAKRQVSLALDLVLGIGARQFFIARNRFTTCRALRSTLLPFPSPLWETDRGRNELQRLLSGRSWVEGKGLDMVPKEGQTRGLKLRGQNPVSEQTPSWRLLRFRHSGVAAFHTFM